MTIEIQGIRIKFAKDFGRDKSVVLNVSGENREDIVNQIKSFAADHIASEGYDSGYKFDLERTALTDIGGYKGVNQPSSDEGSE